MKIGNRNERNEEQNEAAIGIGAMIVFIALILVAAVASAVIIQTGEKLQQNAQSAGEGTKDAMATKITIVNAIMTDTGNDQVTLTIRLAPGSDPITATAIEWIATCPGGAADQKDSGAFGAGTTDLDSTGAGAATLSPNLLYAHVMTFTDCNGQTAVDVYIQAGGGGFTMETLNLGAGVADGDLVI